MRLNFIIDRNPIATRSVLLDLKNMNVIIPHYEDDNVLCINDYEGLEEYIVNNLPFSCIEIPTARRIKIKNNWRTVLTNYTKYFKRLPIYIPIVNLIRIGNNHIWKMDKKYPYIIKIEEIESDYKYVYNNIKYIIISYIKFKIYKEGVKTPIRDVEYKYQDNIHILSKISNDLPRIIYDVIKEYINIHVLNKLVDGKEIITLLKNDNCCVNYSIDNDKFVIINKRIFNVLQFKYFIINNDYIEKLLSEFDLYINRQYKGYIQFRFGCNNNVFTFITKELFERYIDQYNVNLKYNLSVYSYRHDITENITNIKNYIKLTISNDIIYNDKFDLENIKDDEEFMNTKIEFDDSLNVGNCKIETEKFYNEYGLDKNSGVKIKWIADNWHKFSDFHKKHIIPIIMKKMEERN